MANLASVSSNQFGDQLRLTVLGNRRMEEIIDLDNFIARKADDFKVLAEAALAANKALWAAIQAKAFKK